MIKKILLPLLCLFLTACSEDSDSAEYASKPPVFAELTCTPLTPGETEVRAGQRFVVTLVQKQKGRLLNTTKYEWSDKQQMLQHKYVPSVIYDNQSQNPTDTIVAPSAGTYNLTFKGTYNASGNTQWWAQKYGANSLSTLSDGTGRVNYLVGGLFYFTVTVEKAIQVKP